jgi:Putative regulator of cell autolysis
VSSWIDFFYVFIFGTALLLSALGIFFAAVIPGIDRWNKQFFLGYFVVFLLCCLSSLMETVFYYYSVPRGAVYCVILLECLLLSLPLPMLTAYLLHCCGERLCGGKLPRAVLGLMAVYSALLASARLTGVFAYLPSDNLYRRGPLYPLLVLPLIAIQLLNFAGAVRRRRQLSRKAFLSFLIAILPITVALTAQLFTDAFPLIDISYVVSAFAMYGFILSDQIEQDRRHQREITRQQLEIANQRASIMVLQMRPHFIYNTMTSIFCLCGQNPQTAQQVVMDFTAYLRKNFTAIASDAPIPFTSELEHTRAYLAVEQAVYEDSLFVDYDTPHTFFRVPPLTLQPIVENAVKHGRDPCAGPLHISIRTRKTDSGSEIVVADNGRGFEPSDDGGLGIALNNIQQRLEIMCDGRLTIAPNEGGGTVVTVTIPDRAAE